MFWPILECSAIATGLWFVRQSLPNSLSPYADVIALGLIVTMFVWLARRAGRRGEQRGERRGERRGIQYAVQHDPNDYKANMPRNEATRQVSQDGR